MFRRGDRREKPEQRGDYERDRDRVLYTDALRRLALVTQVVGAAEGHLFHNRLTHTLKVAQIARRVAERLLTRQGALADRHGGLDPDVVETAALIHDLGHPPFGHVAEAMLDELARAHNAPDGFEGNAQSFRIVTRLAVHRDADAADGYEGLNLTRATLNATLKYPYRRDQAVAPDGKRYRKFGAYEDDAVALEFARAAGPEGDAQSLEAAVLDYADDVAYSVHDLEDFFRAGLIPVTTLSRGGPEFEEFLTRWCEHPRAAASREEVFAAREILLSMIADLFPFRGRYEDTLRHRAILRTATSNLIQRYIWAVSVAEPGTGRPLHVPPTVRLQLDCLQRLVRTYVIDNPRLATQQHGQRHIISTLFDTYLAAVMRRDAALVPPLFHRALGRLDTEPNAAPTSARVRTPTSTPRSPRLATPAETRLAVDIVASFSDAQAVLLHRRLQGTAPGSVTDYLTP